MRIDMYRGLVLVLVLVLVVLHIVEAMAITTAVAVLRMMNGMRYRRHVVRIGRAHHGIRLQRIISRWRRYIGGCRIDHTIGPGDIDHTWWRHRHAAHWRHRNRCKAPITANNDEDDGE